MGKTYTISIDPYDDDIGGPCPLRGDPKKPGPPCLHHIGADICYPHLCPLKDNPVLIVRAVEP